MKNLEERLESEWKVLCIRHYNETLEIYNEGVRSGNTQTYSEFMENIKKKWFKEMRKKYGKD